MLIFLGALKTKKFLDSDIIFSNFLIHHLIFLILQREIMSHLDIKDHSPIKSSESITKLSEKSISNTNKEDIDVKKYNTEEYSVQKNISKKDNENKYNDASSGLLAMPSKRLNLTYRAVLLTGGEEEKRRAVVDILKKCQIQDGEEGEEGNMRGIVLRCNVM